MNRWSVSRRHLIAAIGVPFLSGCGELGQSDSNGEPRVPLGSLFASNPRGEPQSVQVELKREDEIVYEDTLEVPDGGEVIDPVWSTDPAEYDLLWETDEQQGNVSIPGKFHITDSEECHYVHFNFRIEQVGPVVDLLTSEDIETGAGTC